MIVYYLFVHKKSVSKRNVCIIFIKNKKVKKNPKKPTFSGFFRWIFWVFLGFFGWVFLGGFFNANPVPNSFHKFSLRTFEDVFDIKAKTAIRIPSEKTSIFTFSTPPPSPPPAS